MGLDVPDICQVVHWGPSDDLESYIQETGRAGLVMEICVVQVKISRHQLLFSDFEECDVDTCCKCRSCNMHAGM